MIESAVLDTVPDAGVLLGLLTTVVARDDAVTRIGAVLRERKVPVRSPWRPDRIIAGRRLRRRLRADPPEGLGRVAVLGAAGITDTRLREIFQTSHSGVEESRNGQ